MVLLIALLSNASVKGWSINFNNFIQTGGNPDMLDPKQITFEQAKKLIHDKNGELNKRYSRPHMSKVYNLDRGEMLVIGKKACYVYKSENEIRRLLEGGVRKESILFNLNSYGKSFPATSNDSHTKLSEFLGIPKARLDYTEESLNQIDNVLIRKYKKKEIDHTALIKNVIFFISYAGEVFNKKYKATWLMILDEDGRTWLPYNSINSKRIDLFNYVYSSLCELSPRETPLISSGYFARVNGLKANFN